MKIAVATKSAVAVSDNVSYMFNGEVRNTFQRNEIAERTERKIGMAEYAFRRITNHPRQFETHEAKLKVMTKEQYENTSSRRHPRKIMDILRNR